MAPLPCLMQLVAWVNGLGGSVDSLFEAGAADDLVAIAETCVRASLAVLVPQLCDAGVELAELRGEDDVMSTGQTVQESGTVLAGALDLRTDVVDGFHAYENETNRSCIPSSR